MPARGVAAFEAAIRFASAPTTRCRSAYLVEVCSNHRLLGDSSMRRAKQCRYFASSLPPNYRHTRLTIVRRGCCQVATRRDSWRSHVHRTHTAQRVQSFKNKTRNVGGRGVPPSSFSGGIQRGYSLREENTPFDSALPCQWEPPFSAFALKKHDVTSKLHANATHVNPSLLERQNSRR